MRRVGLEEYVTACSDIYDLVQTQGLAQSGDPGWPSRCRAPGGGRWATAAACSGVACPTEIPLVEAVTWALWARPMPGPIPGSEFLRAVGGLMRLEAIQHSPSASAS